MNASTATIEEQIKYYWGKEQDCFAEAEKFDILSAELVEANPGLDIDRMAKEFAESRLGDYY
jgi:hypothetical protein